MATMEICTLIAVVTIVAMRILWFLWPAWEYFGFCGYHANHRDTLVAIVSITCYHGNQRYFGFHSSHGIFWLLQKSGDVRMYCKAADQSAIFGSQHIFHYLVAINHHDSKIS